VKTLDPIGRDHSMQHEDGGLPSLQIEMAAKLVRVLIAEDHAVVREGTRKVLERDPLLETVAEAEDGRQAVSLAAQLKPDVVLLDVTRPRSIAAAMVTVFISEPGA